MYLELLFYFYPYLPICLNPFSYLSCILCVPVHSGAEVVTSSLTYLSYFGCVAFVQNLENHLITSI